MSQCLSVVPSAGDHPQEVVLNGWRIRLHQDLYYPWFLFFPFTVLPDTLPLTAACRVYQKIQEAPELTPLGSSWIH